MDQKRKIEKDYKIGDKLVAINKFHLTDILNKDFYYGVGDEFYLMNIVMNDDNNYAKFVLNSVDSVFIWYIDYIDISDFEEFLIHKSKFSKIIRKRKLEKINR